MDSKIPIKDGKIRKFAFKCKMKDLIIRLDEEIKKGGLIRSLKINS